MDTGITTLSVRNYGCLQRVDDVELGSLVALVGPNDSGKSLLLGAIERVGRALIEQQGYRAQFPDRQTFLQHTFRGRGGSFDFELAGVFDGAAFGYKTQLGWMEPGQYCHFLQERLELGNVQLARESNVTTAYPEKSPIVFGEISDQTVPMLNLPLIDRAADSPKQQLEFASRVKQAANISRLLTTARVYALRPEFLRLPSPAAFKEMQPNGYGLPSAFAQLLLRRRDVSSKIEEALRYAMPNLKEVNIEPIELNKGEQGYRLEILTPQGVRIPHDLISDGVFLFLGYLYLALGSSDSRILLVEEPETGIHPGLLARLVGLFRDMAKGTHGGEPTQILMTTHSPLLVNLLEPEEIRLVRRNAEGATQVTPFTSHPGIHELLEYQGPGEVWINQGEDYLAGSGEAS